MSHREITSLSPIPVLNSKRKYHHVTLEPGNYKLVEIPNPIPEDWRKPVDAPNWWIDQNTGYGMTLEAWVANLNGTVPKSHLAETQF